MVGYKRQPDLSAVFDDVLYYTLHVIIINVKLHRSWSKIKLRPIFEERDGEKQVLKIAVTGIPGIGKSTVVAKAAEKLADRLGFKVCGVRTVEIRREGRREGFSILDLATGEAGILSHTKGRGPKIGKYHINIEDLEKIGAEALRNALSCDLVIIDEIGPMELISGSFVAAVEKVLESDKPVLAVLHRSSEHWLARKVREEFEVLTVDMKNREELPEKIFSYFASKPL